MRCGRIASRSMRREVCASANGCRSEMRNVLRSGRASLRREQSPRSARELMQRESLRLGMREPARIAYARRRIGFSWQVS